MTGYVVKVTLIKKNSQGEKRKLLSFLAGPFRTYDSAEWEAEEWRSLTKRIFGEGLKAKTTLIWTYKYKDEEAKIDKIKSILRSHEYDQLK